MKIIIQICLVLAILGLGVLGAVLLLRARPEPTIQAPEEMVLPVQIVTAQRSDVTRKIAAGGTVMPARDVRLQSQVSGEVLEVAPHMIPGGVVEAGTLLVQLDTRDYRNQVRQREADVVRARLVLEEERGRKVVAQQEWDLLGKELETTTEGRALALREPQLAQAKAALAAAEAALEQAQLNLQRTEIRAPFNAMVLSESVEVGQVVTPQSVIARLVGTDQYWVRATLNSDWLTQLQLPNAQGQDGAEAQVLYANGSQRRRGQVLRLLPDMEGAGQMARLLVAIDDPLALKQAEQQVPLLLDAYVDVEIEGRSLNDVVAVPVRALREGNQVWIMNSEDRFEIRNVEVAWRARDQVYLKGNLIEGERIIISPLPAPVPGLKLRLTETADAEGTTEQTPAAEPQD